MANLKKLAVILFGVLASGASAFRRQLIPLSSTNYYANNQATQAAEASATGQTTAYNSAIAYPYPYGLGAYYAVPSSNVNYYSTSSNQQAAETSATGQTISYSNIGDGLGDSATNYNENDYNNQTAEASANGQTTAYNAATGLGGSNVNYYNNQYAQQAAALSSNANQLAYNQVLVNPYAYGGYGYPGVVGIPSYGYKRMF